MSSRGKECHCKSLPFRHSCHHFFSGKLFILVRIQCVPTNHIVSIKTSAHLSFLLSCLEYKSSALPTLQFILSSKLSPACGFLQGTCTLSLLPLPSLYSFSYWSVIRLAEVLYPLPDALQASLEQSRETATSVESKLKRRKSLIGDRITTTQEGKSNWNVTISIFHYALFLLFTSSLVPVVNSATPEHNFY
jgi:hypothetical protein